MISMSRPSPPGSSISLPQWVPPQESLEESRAWEVLGASDPIDV